VGFILLSTVHSFLNFFLIYIFVVALGNNAGFYHPVSAAVNAWFIRPAGCRVCHYQRRNQCRRMVHCSDPFVPHSQLWLANRGGDLWNHHSGRVVWPAACRFTVLRKSWGFPDGQTRAEIGGEASRSLQPPSRRRILRFGRLLENVSVLDLDPGHHPAGHGDYGLGNSPDPVVLGRAEMRLRVRT